MASSARRARITILTERYHPEQTSTGYILTRLAEGLAERFDVTVITGPASDRWRPVSLPREDERNGVRIFRGRGTGFDKNRVVARIVNWMTQMPSFVWLALRHCVRGDILLVVTNPPLLPFLAVLVKRIRGCGMVLLVHDVYPEVLIATGWLREGSLLARVGAIANAWLYRAADRIVTIGRDMSELVGSKVPDRRDRIVCIPNWAEHDLVRPGNRAANRLLRALGLVDKFVVLFAGNLGRAQGIENLAHAAASLDRTEPDIHFLFIGYGARKRWLEEFLAAHRLRNVTILDRLPRSRQDEFLNACDLALTSLAPGMVGVGVPSRMYNQLAAGKPQVVICDVRAEHARLVREEEVGWVVAPGDASSLIDVLRRVAREPELCGKLGARAANVARDRFSFERILDAYGRLFHELSRQCESGEGPRGLRVEEEVDAGTVTGASAGQPRPAPGEASTAAALDVGYRDGSMA